MKRWWVIVRDINGTPVSQYNFWTKWGARKEAARLNHEARLAIARVRLFARNVKLPAERLYTAEIDYQRSKNWVGFFAEVAAASVVIAGMMYLALFPASKIPPLVVFFWLAFSCIYAVVVLVRDST